jgi:hypothetical protein
MYNTEMRLMKNHLLNLITMDVSDSPSLGSRPSTSKAPTITRLNGFVSIFIHKRLRYCLPFNRNDHTVLHVQNFLIIACNHRFYQF